MRGKIFWAYRPQFSSWRWIGILTWTWIAILIGVIALLTVSLSRPAALVMPPITSSELNTQISVPTTLPSGQINYNITGGTRPGAVLAKRKFQAEEGSRVATRH